MSYHIAKNDAPAICTAQPGKCPLGNQDKHFDTVEEAQVYADQLNQKYRDAYNGFKEKLKKDRLEAIENNKDKINELKEKLNLNELPEFLIDEIITGGFEYSHQKQKDRAAKLRSNELQQAIKDRKQKQNRLFKNPFKN
jgi:hypothetical protein